MKKTWPGRRAITDPLVSTSLMMLLPAMVWYAADQPLQALLVAFGALASTFYHLRGEPEGLILGVDIAFATAALVATVWAFLAAVIEHSNHSLLWLAGAMFFGMAADQCFRASARAINDRDVFRYEIIHAIWHGIVLQGQFYLVFGVLTYSA